METVNYNKSKLAMHALVAAVIVLLGYWLMTHTGEAHGRYRLFSGSFGRYFIAPLMILGGGAHVWRALLTLMGHGRALVFGSDGITATTLWKTTHIPWDKLGHVEIRSYGNWLATNYQLVLHYGRVGIIGGRKVRLLLGATDLPSDDYESWLNQLEMLKARIGQGERPAFGGASPGRVPQHAAIPEPQGDGFDPDAALARYMARKATEENTAPPAPQPGPVRPVFGRKAV